MDTKTLDKAIIDIIEKKNTLSNLTYDDKNYDKIEEELHDLEDDFIERFGDYFEEVLEKVHEEICPESDVLLPIAYFAHKYKTSNNTSDGTTTYDVADKEGVWVEAEKYPGKDTRLVLIPNPTRIVLNIGGKKEVVWQSGKEMGSL